MSQQVQPADLLSVNDVQAALAIAQKAMNNLTIATQQIEQLRKENEKLKADLEHLKVTTPTQE